MTDFLVQQLPLLLLLILRVVFAAEHPDLDDCPMTICGGDGPLIQSPFRQKNYPLHCGHPDFEVFCLNNITMIQLSSSSGIFPIRTVDFKNQYFEVYDQEDGCLPRRLFNFTISSESPFQPLLFGPGPEPESCRFDHNSLTLLNCSTALNFSTSSSGSSTDGNGKYYYPIKCLSVPGHHQVLAAPEYTSIADLPVRTCSTSLRQVYLPLRSVDGSNDHCELDSRLFLWWQFEDGACSSDNCNGSCRLNRTSTQVECYPLPIFHNPEGM